MLIKYSQKYNFFVFVSNTTEVETAALKIFCVMIPSLVYTCRDFGLFRVVRPHYITLPYITLHYITLHYITLHYITLHYITLH